MRSQKSYEESQAGKLYLVPTPIGNLEDMTFRAVKTLQEVDWIAAEDTRHSRKLLNHYDIHKPLVSYHEHNKEGRIPELIAYLEDGQDGAQVSDAGTPSLSDPGYELVHACIQAGIDVIPLPGANAATTALIASGIQPQPFYFYGFLPAHKKERKQELQALAQISASLIIYESPHRLKAMLKDAVAILGGQRQACLARELSKHYEEILRGSLDEALAWSSNQEVRGELCVVIEGRPKDQVDLPAEAVYISYADHVQQLIDSEGRSPKEAIKQVAMLHNVSKRLVYNEFHDL